MAIPAFGSISSGETICGTAWANAGVRDTDWYEFTLAEPRLVEFKVVSQLPMVIGIVNTGGIPSCSLATSLMIPFGVSGLCGEAEVSNVCLGAGTWWLFVAPNTFSGFPCGSGSNDYFVQLLISDIPCDPPGCGNSDHSCFETGGPYCDDEKCCLLVCAIDPFCCNVAWDSICVTEANLFCEGGSGGPCGENASHDCYSTGAPGCTDEACCQLVCSVDLFCCQVAWDAICVAEALQFCGVPKCPFECPPGSTPEGEPCGESTNGGCNPNIISDSNCCVAHFGIGCDDPDCSALICSIDPFCCDVAWDGICALEAIEFCPDTCQVEYNFGSISCGETICGNAWAFGGTRDTDWYEITLTDEPGTLVTFSIVTTLPMVIGIVDTNGIPDCSLASFLNPFAVAEFCGSASVSACLPPGTYWFFAAPNGFDGFPCGSGANDYYVTLECLGVCEPPACGNSDHSCFVTGGPYCDDEKCCLIVCAMDPFCCDVAWDSICVAEANQFCEGGGGGPCEMATHDCFTVGGPGCTDIACCNTVCAIDPFCCAVAWDSICVAEAVALCGGGGDPCETATHDCFTTGGPGCTDIACCNTVCAIDPFCCAVAWDSICVAEAEKLCVGGCPGDPDLNGDGCVDGADLGILLGLWGVGGGLGPADLNCDEIVDGADLGILLGAWTGPGC